MPIVPDDKDWTWVLERRCPQCGFHYPADVVTTSLVLHNLRSPTDRQQVLQNAFRVLKPGGRLLVADIRNIDEYKLVLQECGAENLTVRDFGLRACFGLPRLRLISGSK